MGQKIRKTGIDIIGDVPWGTHFCQFYQNKEDLVDILLPYFKAGLENNECCLWITSQPLSEKEAKKAMRKAVPDFDRYLKKGQIEIIPHTEWYVKDGAFNLQRVLDAWINKLKQALAKGYDGLRLTDNTAWLEKKDWRSFTDYEKEINNVIGNYRMMAICTYSLDRCGAAELIDVVRNHQFALIRREGKWELMESYERKQAEETLHQSEFKYRSLFDNMLDGFAYCKILLDDNNHPIDFVYLELNQAFERLTGLKKEDVLGKKVTEAIPGIKDSYPALFDIYGKVALTGKEAKFDLYFEPLQRWLSISVYSPRKGYFVAIFDNITKRKKAEEALRKSEEKLRNILGSSPDAITVTDLEGNIIECNQATLEMHGFSCKEELIGKSALDSIAPKDREKVVDGMKKIIEQGSIKNMEYIGLAKDGREFVGELSASVMRDPFGKPTSFIAIMSDISLRKKMEEALQIERDRLYAVTQNVGVGLAVITKDHRILAGNEVLKQMFGKVEGKMCYLVFNQRTEVCPGCGAREIFRTGRDKVVHEQKTKDLHGNTVWLEIVTTPIKDKEGNVTAALQVLVPITERKKTEEKIKEYAEELKIRNLELKLETEKAKEADRLKSEFLANMSHEIRTPLTAISGAAYLLNESSLSSEQRKLCRMITQSEKHLLQLINDILDLARIEAGEVSLEEEEFSLKDSLERIISTFKLEARKKELKLDLVYPSHLPARIVSDERKITQIASNFLSNAVKFTEEGKIEVRVDEEADSKMQVLVKDTGVGIPKDKLSHIFDKFYQVNGTIRRRYSGTGLGLAIVKGLVDLLGGEIEAQSTSGKGSLFSFNFPYKPIEKEVVKKKEEAKLKSKIRDKTKKDINILIAEDDDFNYYIIDRFLKDYTTTRAKDGKDVLEKIEKKRFDLILMDIQMPEMDGLTATRKIREKDLNLPIIALTAKSMKGDEEKCLAAGCSDYISKPIAPDELMAKIEQYTAKRLVRGEESFPVKILDIEILLENSGKDKSLAKETLHMFLEYLPQQLSRIRKAIADGNSQNLERLSHSLKGAAKSAGAPGIAKLAYNLEEAAASTSIDQTEATFSQLRKEKERFQITAEKMPIS